MINFAAEFCGSSLKVRGKMHRPGDMRREMAATGYPVKTKTIKEIKTNSHVKNLSDHRQESDDG